MCAVSLADLDEPDIAFHPNGTAQFLVLPETAEFPFFNNYMNSSSEPSPEM
jgi:hypothetical protein